MLSVAVTGRQTPVLLALLLARPSQDTAPRYSADMLRCAAFREEVRSEIRSETGTVVRPETAGRDGFLIVRAARADSGVAITAWYDSLTVWRQSPEGRVAPDAEGLLGGRWQGALSAEGRYAGVDVPFIPDDVAEIADLRGVLGDFFPPLGPGVLKTTSTRDSRYTWSIKARTDTTVAVNDTLELPIRRESEEEGSLTWDRKLGPVHWERSITVKGNISAAGPIRRSVRSVVTQRIRVTRVPSQACD